MIADPLLVPLIVTLALVLLLMEVPVAFALGAAGALGLLLDGGTDFALASLGALPYTATASYTLTIVPMFILMGSFASHSGMLDGVFSLVERLTRRIPGGLAISASLAGVLLGGVSGSSVADAATIGRVSLGEMTKRGYERAFAAAVVAAGGTAAILIPPSIVLVIYGVLTGESIGELLIAGIVPGLLTAVVEVVVIIIVTRRLIRRGDMAPVDEREPVAGPSKVGLILGPIFAAMLMVTVVGGIYAGVFTAIEAGAMGAGMAFVLSFAYSVAVRRAEGRARLATIAREALSETSGLTASVLMLVVGSAIFTNFLVVRRVPATITDWVFGLELSPALVVLIFLLMLLPLGMLIDGFSLLLIVTPLAYPVITALDFDGLWLGILLVKMIEIGLITPPVGLNVYVVAGLDDRLSVEAIFRRITPFVIGDLVLIAIFFVFPETVTWLPAQIGG